MAAELEKVQLRASEIFEIMMPSDRRLQWRIALSVALLIGCRVANIMVRTHIHCAQHTRRAHSNAQGDMRACLTRTAAAARLCHK
jgi:hypothetical protein